MVAGRIPGLSHDSNAQVISGDLDFCATYNVTSGSLELEGTERPSTVAKSDARACGVFAVRIELGVVADAAIDWPAVYESGGRCASLAEALEIPVQDLHVNSDGSCCLGIQIDPARTALNASSMIWSFRSSTALPTLSVLVLCARGRTCGMSTDTELMASATGCGFYPPGAWHGMASAPAEVVRSTRRAASG